MEENKHQLLIVSIVAIVAVAALAIIVVRAGSNNGIVATGSPTIETVNDATGAVVARIFYFYDRDYRSDVCYCSYGRGGYVASTVHMVDDGTWSLGGQNYFGYDGREACGKYCKANA